ncbi:hypothetical protein [Endozoicomonas atrinae]|uniref:hypothetical protein n=1 Tax=Endozoicomonas atrinae TaxID=1333660 RepID=UPI0008257FF6|nr:hypothetical protein [Endozoicomonas atrinae]
MFQVGQQHSPPSFDHSTSADQADTQRQSHTGTFGMSVDVATVDPAMHSWTGSYECFEGEKFRMVEIHTPPPPDQISVRQFLMNESGDGCYCKEEFDLLVLFLRKGLTDKDVINIRNAGFSKMNLKCLVNSVAIDWLLQSDECAFSQKICTLKDIEHWSGSHKAFKLLIDKFLFIQAGDGVTLTTDLQKFKECIRLVQQHAGSYAHEFICEKVIRNVCNGDLSIQALKWLINYAMSPTPPDMLISRHQGESALSESMESHRGFVASERAAWVHDSLSMVLSRKSLLSGMCNDPEVTWQHIEQLRYISFSGEYPSGGLNHELCHLADEILSKGILSFEQLEQLISEAAYRAITTSKGRLNHSGEATYPQYGLDVEMSNAKRAKCSYLHVLLSVFEEIASTASERGAESSTGSRYFQALMDKSNMETIIAFYRGYTGSTFGFSDKRRHQEFLGFLKKCLPASGEMNLSPVHAKYQKMTLHQEEVSKRQKQAKNVPLICEYDSHYESKKKLWGAICFEYQGSIHRTDPVSGIQDASPCRPLKCEFPEEASTDKHEVHLNPKYKFEALERLVDSGMPVDCVIAISVRASNKQILDFINESSHSISQYLESNPVDNYVHFAEILVRIPQQLTDPSLLKRLPGCRHVFFQLLQEALPVSKVQVAMTVLRSITGNYAGKLMNDHIISGLVCGRISEGELAWVTQLAEAKGLEQKGKVFSLDPDDSVAFDISALLKSDDFLELLRVMMETKRVGNPEFLFCLDGLSCYQIASCSAQLYSVIEPLLATNTLTLEQVQWIRTHVQWGINTKHLIYLLSFFGQDSVAASLRSGELNLESFLMNELEPIKSNFFTPPGGEMDELMNIFKDERKHAQEEKSKLREVVKKMTAWFDSGRPNLRPGLERRQAKITTEEIIASGTNIAEKLQLQKWFYDLYPFDKWFDNKGYHYYCKQNLTEAFRMLDEGCSVEQVKLRFQAAINDLRAVK